MGARHRLVIWWHRKQTGHHTRMRRVVRIDGALAVVMCDCGKLWLH